MNIGDPTLLIKMGSPIKLESLPELESSQDRINANSFGSARISNLPSKVDAAPMYSRTLNVGVFNPGIAAFWYAFL